MKINLFTTLYIDKNKLRQNELETCVFENILNDLIDRVFVLIENPSIFYGYKSNTLKSIQNKLEEQNPKAIAIFVKKRPSFKDYFEKTQGYKNDINIISNSDIVFNKESLKRLKKWNWGNYCLALSRYDIKRVDNLYCGELFDRADSQDTWIKKGAFPNIPKATFTMGIAGCDNVIAHLLSNHLTIINPSLEIKTYHLHLTNVRNYIENGKLDEIKRLPPPYKLIKPTCLPN